MSQQVLLDELRQKQQYIEELEAKLAEINPQTTGQNIPQIRGLHHHAYLLDFVLDAVVSTDLDFNILTWNKAAEDMYGWTEAEVLGRYSTGLFKTGYFDNSSSEDVQGQYREQGVWRGELIHHRKDGTVIPVRATTSTICDENGEAVGVVTILSDISEELEAARALKESEERYRIISELMSDYAYMYHFDEDGKWQHVWSTDEALTRVVGYSREDVDSTNILYHPDELDLLKQDMQKLLAGEDTEIEHRIITKDGQHRWIDTRRRVLWDENHERVIGFYGASKDITARKYAEEQLIEYNKEKERVSILQNFIKDVSHDLKTPLSTINTSIYILRKIATTDKQRIQLDKLGFNADHLGKLIEGMFDMSRLDLIQELSLADFDLNPILQDIIVSYTSLAEDKQISLRGELQKSPFIASVNLDSMTQAIMNIVENAIRFTSENGQIVIRTYQDNDGLVIAIEDTGIGIPSDELAHIFTRFYRGDKSRGANEVTATGLGLSMSRKITELHKGEIDVESKLGEGSCFYIRLPKPTIG